MPDLSSDVIMAWLRDREPHLVVRGDDDERPVDDHAAVLPAVLRLGGLLDECLARAPAAFRARFLSERTRATTRAVLAQLGQGRRLRLLQWLSDVPGLEDLPADLLRDASSETGVFLRAEIVALHRVAALDRIFGEERIAMLLAACTHAVRPENLQ